MTPTQASIGDAQVARERLGELPFHDLACVAAGLVPDGVAALTLFSDDGHVLTLYSDERWGPSRFVGAPSRPRLGGDGVAGQRDLPVSMSEELCSSAGDSLGRLVVYAVQDADAHARTGLQQLARLAVSLVEQAEHHAERARLEARELSFLDRLRTTDERFAQLVEEIDDVVFEQDAEGRWSFLNPAWRRVTGQSVEASIGRPYLDFVHPEDQQASRARFEGLLKSGTHDGSQAVRYATTSGGWRWLEARARPVCDSGGRRVGAVGTLRDITARRELAEELAAAYEGARRTQALMADFLANISHEVRTPLNGVLGLLRVLLDGPLTVSQHALVADAHASAQTLLRLVSDIQDLSRLEAGDLTLKPEAFDLRSWVGQAIRTVGESARAKGLRLEHIVDPRVPAYVWGDAARLEQVLGNLLDNAVKFTDEGGVAVAVTAAEGPDGRHVLRVGVVDSGVGVPPGLHHAIFEKYRQADGTAARPHGGAGLGLAVCRRLVALMGGQIGVESEGSGGSTFWFGVPLVAAEAPTHSTEAGETLGDPAADRAPLVLVAEDNALNQFIARRFLERAGCQVEVVANGIQAVEAVRTRVYDAVFMDCQMPVLDGYEATRRIRASGEGGLVPIVAMTAHGLAGDRERCLAAGMSDYMTKPLSPESVAGVVRRVRRLPAARPGAGGERQPVGA
jgi:PAS domain S-box-containing protein